MTATPKLSVAQLADANKAIEHALARSAEQTWRAVTSALEAVLRPSNSAMMISPYNVRTSVTRTSNNVLAAVRVTGVRHWSQAMQTQLINRLGSDIEWEGKVHDAHNTITITVWKAIDTPELRGAPAESLPAGSDVGAFERALDACLPVRFVVTCFVVGLLLTLLSYVLFDADQAQLLAALARLRGSASA